MGKNTWSDGELFKGLEKRGKEGLHCVMMREGFEFVWEDGR